MNNSYNKNQVVDNDNIVADPLNKSASLLDKNKIIND